MEDMKQQAISNKMKAYVCSIGEKTTALCVEQLEKFGFDVTVLNEIEPWVDKYKRFIKTAEEDCIRIDADILVNKNIRLVGLDIPDSAYAVGHATYDMYQNMINTGGPVFYTKKALDIIRKNLDKIGTFRPEVTAVRLPEMEGHVDIRDLIIGIHGVGQDQEAIERAKQNKINRKQIQNYDFELVEKLNNLCKS